MVTCGLADRIAEVRPRVERSPYWFALVTTEERIVLGRLRTSAMRESAGDARAEDAMQPGPSTVRCDAATDELARRLRDRELVTAVVSTPEGRLVGVVRRADLEAAARDGREGS